MGLLEPHGRGRCLLRRDALTGSSKERRCEPVFVVHSLDHAVAALTAAAEAGRPIAIISAPSAGVYGGPGWFKAVADAAREAVPAARFSAILDCDDDAGAAQGAIRAEIDVVIFTGRADVAERLAGIAAAAGSRLLTERPAAALDLARWFLADGETLRRHCAAHLASPGSIC
jgi:hypothetical protein